LIPQILFLLAAGAACSPPERLLTWPSPRDPAWSLCVLTPQDSSGASGSGLEIRDVHFNGRRVLRRAHAPIVNAFHEGGCGCWRGWAREEARFEVVGAAGPVGGGAGSYAEAAVPPRTTCDTGSEDTGAFRGVAAESLTDRLILTTHMSAAWDRYTMSWTFRLDGTIEPRFAFTSVPSACSSESHAHHVYWRFDFDLGGEVSGGAGPEREEVRRVGVGRKPPVSVIDPATRRGYSLIPGPEAYAQPADPSSVGDVWVLKPKPDEITDAGSGCAIYLGGLLNDEALDGPRRVVWYRGSVFHAAGRFDECEIVGPTLQPVGDWSRTIRR
jgi:hypothetical protein